MYPLEDYDTSQPCPNTVRPLTVGTILERLEDVLRWCFICLFGCLWNFLRCTFAGLSPLFCDLPEIMHMLLGDYLVHVATEHEDGECSRNTGYLGGRVPFLAADERKNTNDGPASDYARE